MLTRRSSGAGCGSASARARTRRRAARAAAPASQSGRLWRSLSGSVARSTARQRSSHARSCSLERGAQEAVVALPAQDGQAPLDAPPLPPIAPGAETAAARAAPHRWSRPACGARAGRARAGRGRSRTTTRSAGCSKRSTRRTSSVAASSRAFGCIAAIILAPALGARDRAASDSPSRAPSPHWSRTAALIALARSLSARVAGVAWPDVADDSRRAS